jgi:hypothetical protein
MEPTATESSDRDRQTVTSEWAGSEPGDVGLGMEVASAATATAPLGWRWRITRMCEW